MIFIARKNRNDLEMRNDHFPRYRAKAQIKGESLEDKPFLHFESPNDMGFMKRFYEIWSKNEGWSDYEQTINFVFTHTKSDAIKEHEGAIKKDLLVSTLVDMDHDLNDKDFRGVKNVHSTKYACTLFTLQFIKNEKKLDFQKLQSFIEEISGLEHKQCEDIIQGALHGTSTRLNKWRPYITENFNKKKVQYPLNDHELAEAITRASGVSEDSESFNREVRKNEEKLRAHALQDSNGLVRTLLNRMLEDLSPVLKKKPTSN